MVPEVQVRRPVSLLLLFDDHSSTWPQVLGDEALKVTIEEGNSQMIGELAKCFQIPDETIRLDLHYIENSSSKSGYFTYCLKSISDSLFLIAFSALQQTHI